MPSYTIKNFSGGLSDYEDRGIKGAFKNGKALSIRKRIDSLTCNQALTQVSSGVITDLIYFHVPASDGNTYLFGTAKIYKLTSGGTVTLVYTDPDGGICGAAEWWEANGKKYLFWATSTKLKSKEIPGNSDWTVDVNATHTGLPGGSSQTYPKTNLSAATWHTMAEANGALMICNDNYLAMVGWDGSYTNEALRLLPDMSAKTLIDRNDMVIVAAGSASGRQNAHLFSWETTSLNYVAKKRIPAVNINALIDSEVMLMQADTDGNIFFSDMVNFLPVTAFPTGGKVNPGAIAELDGVVYFGVWGSTDATKDGIYSYGRKKKNGLFSLNFEYPITCTEIGALSVISGVLHVSYRVTSSYVLFKVDTANKQTAVYESLDLIAPTKILPDHTNWNGIKLITAPLPAGTSISVAYRLNKSGNFIAAKIEGEVASMEIDGAMESLFLIAGEGEIAEVQVTLTPYVNATPEVYRIELFFDEDV